MSKAKDTLNAYMRLLVLIIAVAGVVYIGFTVDSLSSIIIAIIGFGAIVLFHEFGHFIVAKSTDVKVEAFSIGFPPVLLGIMRTEKGYRIRILPSFITKKG